MLHLIRHAHADWTLDEMRPLSASGRQAAEHVADVLEPLGLTAVYSSPYARAVQTVQPLANRLGLGIVCDDGLRERELTRGRVEDFTATVEATWRDFHFAHPGGESNAHAQARVRVAIGRICAAHDGAIAIASHGNAIALFLQTLDAGVDFEFWKRMPTPAVYAIDVGTGTFMPLVW